MNDEIKEGYQSCTFDSPQKNGKQKMSTAAALVYHSMSINSRQISEGCFGRFIPPIL
jgi:hypothetical protein